MDRYRGLFVLTHSTAKALKTFGGIQRKAYAKASITRARQAATTSRGSTRCQKAVDCAGFVGYEAGENVAQVFFVGALVAEAFEAGDAMLDMGIYAAFEMTDEFGRPKREGWLLPAKKIRVARHLPSGLA